MLHQSAVLDGPLLPLLAWLDLPIGPVERRGVLGRSSGRRHLLNHKSNNLHKI
jgi:hypothetical protein